MRNIGHSCLSAFQLAFHPHRLALHAADIGLAFTLGLDVPSSSVECQRLRGEGGAHQPGPLVARPSDDLLAGAKEEGAGPSPLVVGMDPEPVYLRLHRLDEADDPGILLENDQVAPVLSVEARRPILANPP